jgi:hypothetical protein
MSKKAKKFLLLMDGNEKILQCGCVPQSVVVITGKIFFILLLCFSRIAIPE